LHMWSDTILFFKKKGTLNKSFSGHSSWSYSSWILWG